MIQIQWTCPNVEEAKKIIYLLLEKKLIACANIIPHITSIYAWKGAIETAQEVKVLLKTLDQHFLAIRTLIQENCSYDVPEISKIIIDEANPPYLEWLKEEIQ